MWMLAALSLLSELGSVLAIAFFQRRKYSFPHHTSFFLVLNFYQLLVWHLLRYPICFLLWITRWQVILADILIWIYKNYVHFVMYFVIKDFKLIKELTFFWYLLELARKSFWAWYPLKDGSRAVVLFFCHDWSWICSVFLFLRHFLTCVLESLLCWWNVQVF